MFKFARTLNTDGRGYWSDVAKPVQTRKISVDYVNDEHTFGELRVHFNSSWDVNKDGLIYTDSLFLRELRKELITAGFTKAAAADVDYSEQGMQGDTYVSLDVGKKFLAAWDKMVDNYVPAL